MSSASNKMNTYVLFVSVIAAMGGLLFGYDTAVISGTVEALRMHFSLNPLELGWVVGGALIGCVAGAAIAGKLTDAFGRRAVLLASAALFLISGIWCYFAPSANELNLARIVGGIGVGFSSLLVPVYIAELAPASHRGALVSLNQVAILLGMVLSYIANAWIGSFGDAAWLTETGWRIMLGAEAVPALFFLLLTLIVPESPRWLLKRGRVHDARTILERLHGKAAAPTELAEIQLVMSQQDCTVMELLTRGRRGVLIMAMILALFQAITGINIVMYYAPTIFTSAGIGTGDALSHSVIIGLVMLVFTVGSMFLVDRAGRRPIMLFAAAGMGISLLLLGLMFEGGTTDGRWLLLWVLAYVSSFSIGMGGIYWVVVSEIFPTRVRGAAASISVIFLWGGNYLVSQFFPAMLLALKGNVFHVFALMCALCFVFILIFVPETKGKTLEQIEGELYQGGTHGGTVSVQNSAIRGSRQAHGIMKSGDV
jgi:SP family arabinose:H+ symporter-like MFS transporter